MNTPIYSPDSNKCGVPRVWQFDKNLGQHLIVIGDYKISIIKNNIFIMKTSNAI